MKKPKILKRYRNYLKESFTRKDYVETEKHQWEDAVTVIKNASNETVLEYKKNMKVNSWYDTDYEETAKRKKTDLQDYD